MSFGIAEGEGRRGGDEGDAETKEMKREDEISPLLLLLLPRQLKFKSSHLNADELRGMEESLLFVLKVWLIIFFF